MGRVWGGPKSRQSRRERSEGRHGSSSCQPPMTLLCPTPLSMGHVPVQLKAIHSMVGLMGVFSTVSFPQEMILKLSSSRSPSQTDDSRACRSHRNILSPPSCQPFPSPPGTISGDFPPAGTLDISPHMHGIHCKYEYVVYKRVWG